jgi:hypothetical protein
MLMTAYPRIHETPNLDWNAEFRNAESRFSQLLVHETPNLDWNAEFRNAESRFSQLLVQKLTLDSPKNIISLFMHEERVKFITKSMRTPLFFSSLSQFDMVSFQ